MNPLTALPTKVRKWIYVFYVTLGIAFGATQVGFATAGQDQPVWLLVAFGVFGYLGTALGLVAASNVGPTTVHYVPSSISVDKITAGAATTAESAASAAAAGLRHEFGGSRDPRR